MADIKEKQNNKLNEVLIEKKKKLEAGKTICPFCLSKNDECGLTGKLITDGLYTENILDYIDLWTSNSDAIDIRNLLDMSGIDTKELEKKQLLVYEELIYMRLSRLEEMMLLQRSKDNYICSDMAKINTYIKKEMDEVIESIK
jgi:hypothetical protein